VVSKIDIFCNFSPKRLFLVYLSSSPIARERDSMIFQISIFVSVSKFYELEALEWYRLVCFKVKIDELTLFNLISPLPPKNMKR